MNRILNILVIDSFRELVRYKSFFLLVGFLLLVDRILKNYLDTHSDVFSIPNTENWTEAARWIFEEFPSMLPGLFLDWRTFTTATVLFFAKQLTSMWPTNDMRMMHREERGSWRVWHSLAGLRWQQFAWDMMAVSSVLGLGIIWIGIGFLLGRGVWFLTDSPLCLIAPFLMAAFVWPIGMAGFSYSSKLAVLNSGFPLKAYLFYQLFSNRRVFIYSWLFYTVRIIISVIFVLIIPISTFLTVDNFLLRITIASLSAAPAYSYVKMASFKFFLEVYRPYPEVMAEYADYYQQTHLTEVVQLSSSVVPKSL